VQRISRRTVLVGIGASFVLAACGDGGDDASSGTGAAPDGSDGAASGDDLVLVQRWPPASLVPGSVRLPVSLSTVSGTFVDGPDQLTGRLVDSETGELYADGLTATRHRVGEGTPTYFPFIVEIDRPGLFVLEVDDGPADGAGVQTVDPEQVNAPIPGEALPPFDTPTVDDARGVDPICTRQPEPCPFHEVTLTDALATGVPVGYLIGTPAHCSTGTCGPVLEAMIPVKERLGDAVVFVHAEVYADPAATETSPAVDAYRMEFEPALWVTDASGTIVTRLDSVFDEEELLAALAQAGVDVS
jgi:hypothetical protein